MTPKCPDCKRDQDDCICASPASVPEGWMLVPEIPTTEQSAAGHQHYQKAMQDVGDFTPTGMYKAMLAAAPTPPITEDRKDAERYRWLCDNSNDTEDFARYFEGVPANEYNPKYKEHIDKEIDAAMQEGKL